MMSSIVIHPIDFFNQWFAEPIIVTNNSVAGIIDALNDHPMAQDETAQDYVMRACFYREHPGRFRIYGENQDNYYCFVNEGDEDKIDPPVYFESHFDLKTDYGFDDSEIVNNSVIVADRFTDFLWQMLGHHICLRLESGGNFATDVSGIPFEKDIKLDNSFINHLGRDFPAGFTCFISDDTIYIPDWGAAFLTVQSRDSFVEKYSPYLGQEWS
jgi:hypothetical protein